MENTETKWYYGRPDADGSRTVYELAPCSARCIGRLMPTSDAPQKPKSYAMQLLQEKLAREGMQ